MAEKITYLDGLRGIAAVNVMIMHFFLVLAPAMVYGNQTPSHLGNLDLIFSSTPLGLIGAGNFSVCIFFVLSGYVLTQNYFRTRDKNLIISGALRRYIRLLIPVFAAIMLSFLLSSAGLFRYYSEVVTITANNNPANYWLTFWTFTPNIVDVIKQATLDSFFFGGIDYNPVLWTMKVEFFGSMLVFAMALLFGSLRQRWLIYLAAAVVFIKFYYLAFIIGMAFADLFANKTQLFKTSNKIILSVVLIVGLFIGSYPVYTLTNDSLYSFLNTDLFFRPFVDYHIFGAGLIMYVLLNNPWLQKVFSSAVPVFLGKISYSLYLVHFQVICSFTCILFLVLYPILSYGTALLVSMIVSSILIFPLSYLFYKYVDTAGVKLSKVVYTRVFSPLVSDCAERIKQQRTLSSIFAIHGRVVNLLNSKLCWRTPLQAMEYVRSSTSRMLCVLKVDYLYLIKRLIIFLISMFLNVAFLNH
jgi:peptidoglycan/LPS O-acetylase OafA/YrhL